MEITLIDIFIASFIVSFAIVLLAKRSIRAANKKIELLRRHVQDQTLRTERNIEDFAVRIARREEDKENRHNALERNIELLQRDIEELKSVSEGGAK